MADIQQKYFLDFAGLQTLWNKIKASFASKNDINNIPSLVPDNEIIEFFSQFVGIEIIGSDEKNNDGNIIEGAINILKR